MPEIQEPKVFQGLDYYPVLISSHAAAGEHKWTVLWFSVVLDFLATDLRGPPTFSLFHFAPIFLLLITVQ